jgi:ubiquinone/menaquinone biosynthesis C-methylase UbiE
VPINLPYFDDIFGRSTDSPVVRAFERHVHWGYYASPQTADDSNESYWVAAEAMSLEVTNAARVRDGRSILDVGCGFGGTIAHLNERLSNCELVGVNIDERQVLRARERVKPLRENSVRFVTGDACALPFDAATFDVVMAVECIFHFPSRQKFFSEARRVLRPGGTLMVSDMVIVDEKAEELAAWLARNTAGQSPWWGSTPATSSSGYAAMARTEGFSMLADTDITAETMPTYPYLKRLYREAKQMDGVKASAFCEEQHRRGFLQYRILSFEV